MQHYMIVKKGEKHPIFDMTYLPENIASLFETFILLTEGLFALIFFVGLVVNEFEVPTTSNAFLFIFYSLLGKLLAAFKLPNNTIGNIIALGAVSLTYYLSRFYFEYIKYNLHLLREK